MSRLHGRKKFLVIGAVCTLMAAAGAYAYWTQSGSGTGSAATGSTSAITVNQTSVITGLVPGGSAVTLSGDFTNPIRSPVKVAAVTVAFRSSLPVTDVGGAAITGCSTADYTLGGSSTIGADLTPGPAVTSGSWTGLTIAMNNLGTNQDACKNAVVHLTYTSS
jgi:hypothetical protein